MHADTRAATATWEAKKTIASCFRMLDSCSMGEVFRLGSLSGFFRRGGKEWGRMTACAAAKRDVLRSIRDVAGS